jgi:mannosyl-3-phosphoglycerate phosphatase
MSLSLPPGYQIIIYSDLDGTFLDHRTYSYAESLCAFHLLTGHGVPIVFCSSKTRAEIEPLLKELPGKNPFIIENGAAIYIPFDFFQFPIHQTQIHDRYKIIELGIPYKKVVENFHRLQALFPQTVIGFSDMTAEEIALDAGLSVTDAKQAKQREYSEVFKFTDKNSTMERRIIEKITAYGFVCAQGGRYYHMHGHHDKGLAVQMLNRLFEKKHGRIRTVAIGDSLNDLPMLAIVDQPVLVKKIDGYHDQEIRNRLPHVHLSDGIGPKGWAQTAKEIASELEKT